MTARRLLLAGLLIGAIVAFVSLDAGRWLSLDAVSAHRDTLEDWVRTRPVASGAAFVATYVAAASLSLPGAATVLTLLGGALFGWAWGVVLVSFGSSIGATLAFLSSRFLLRDAVRARFGDRMAALEDGVRRDGGRYLLSLRLIPVFPFFLVNLAMGLTPIATRTFYAASQIGMLPATVVYVNAGTQLSRIESVRGLMSPALFASLLALGLLPLASRRVVDAMAARRARRGWPRPRRFDRNLVVIGAGSGGLVAAYVAAAAKSRVALVERDRMGGDCLNTGCVPSKALLRTAKLLADARDAPRLGIGRMQAQFDFADVMDRVRAVVAAVAPHDSVERYASLGVDVRLGEARIVSPWEIEVRATDGTTSRITTRAIVVATGARPVLPDIPGLDASRCLTSDTVWNLRELPRRLLVLGGGPVGCELALAFARLGARVAVVERGPRLLGREDPDVSELVASRFAAEGIEVLVDATPLRVERDGATRAMVVECADGPVHLPFDAVLCALGRVANVDGLGLEALGVRPGPAGTLEVDAYARTVVPNVYAVGDVAGPYRFTHTASHMAWYAAANALARGLVRLRVDWRVVPWCTFVDPEVARVGLNETEAVRAGIPYEVVRYGLDDLDRAIADGADVGFVKVLTRPGTDRILGATIVGAHAGETIGEFVSAMRHGRGLNAILRTIHVYPTFSEANRHAAGAWRRAHPPVRLLAWAERWHRWGRG